MFFSIYFISPYWIISIAKYQIGCVDTFVPNKDNVIVKEIVFTQKKKPAAPFDGVTGFYSFIMLLRSRNLLKIF